MSKKVPKKRKSSKFNPIGIPSVRDMTQDEEFAPVGKTPAIITAAVEKLVSAVAEERECGCNMIASLASGRDVIDILISHNVVRILGPLIKDASIAVRQAALGALRNISVDGSFEICDRMVELDIMTPLVALMKEYSADWIPDPKKSTENDVYVQGVNLLMNLCESSETTVKIFNREGLAESMVARLDAHLYGYEIAVPTAYCLHTVSDDNVEFGQNEKLMATLPNLLNQPESDLLDHVIMKALLIGILHNCAAGSLRGAHGSLVALVVEQLADVVSRDLVSLADELALQRQRATNAEATTTEADAMVDAAEVDSKQGENGTQNDETNGFDDNHNGDDVIHVLKKREHKLVETSLKRLTNVIAAKQLAFELLSNLCYADGDSDVWEDSMEDGSDGEEQSMDTYTYHTAGDGVNQLCAPSDVHELLLSHHILDHVINACLVSEPDLHDKISRGPEAQSLLKQLRRLQDRALTCLSNMAATMETEALGGQHRVLDTWKGLTKLVKSQHVIADDDLLESVTSCIRAMAQKLAEIDSPVFREVSESDLQFLYQLAHQSANTSVRVHTVRTVATIGCMLAKQRPQHAMMKPIGVFLLVVCMKDADLVVVSETLDAIFDVFAEDHLDSVAKEIGLVTKLKQFEPSFKSKIGQQKSRYRDHMAVISAARTNLTRFIKYKNG